MFVIIFFINQVLFVNRENENCECDMCKTRCKMQSKYIRQIKELYGEENDEIDIEKEEDINMNVINDETKNKNKYYIFILLLQEEEIRGIDLLNNS